METASEQINMVQEEDLSEGDDDENDRLTLTWWRGDDLTTIITILAVLWLLKKIIFGTQRRWFAYVMHMCTKDVFVQLEEVKKDHFASLSFVVSHDPELRKQNAIKILEIGVGTGVNLAHYPDGSRLVVVDPNPYFKSYFDANRKKFPNIYSDEIIVASGDNMEMIGDNSVDVVVMTLVLCSVDNADQILREVLRVLAPGGKFYFMEHIAEFDLERHSLRRRLQDVFTWLRVWPFIFDGCCLNRDMLPNIQRAGFSSVDAHKYYAPVPSFLFDLERPNLKGVAVK
ncbi:thiol S-methyltransferase TMT1A-like isoform X1 [Procambarus clarkii]|uniref:thiol S-methyltransferase TMT1A-like isoform X1 n=1 Tax=Procambarus clarkii TaxID=6728 RepID=UPI001E670011|nr:methyltransferase-like protein 7A [Procambarus clarkii]